MSVQTQADVQVNASVLNIPPTVLTCSDHTPNITSAINTESNPSSPGSGTGTVTFNTSWLDVNGDAVVMYVCSTGLTTSNNSCAGKTYCVNTTRQQPGVNVSCVNFTTNSDPYTNNYNIYLVDNQTTNNASIACAGTFFVGSGAGISGTTLERLGTIGGNFNITDSINCSATLSDSSGNAPNVTIRVFGPLGSLDSPDFSTYYTSYNLSTACESGGAWSTGKLCNWTWYLPGNGTTQRAATCGIAKGLWNCTVNVTSLMAVQTATGIGTRTLANSFPSAVTNVRFGASCGGGALPRTPGSVFAVCANVTDPNGIDDVNGTTSSCGGTERCSALCWAGTGGTPTYNAGTWDTLYTIQNTSMEYDSSGCRSGGQGSRTVVFTPLTNSKSLNGTWSCRINISDAGGGSAVSSATQQATTVDVGAAIATVGAISSVGWAALTPTSAVDWTASDTPVGYTNVTIVHGGNWLQDFRGGFTGNMTDTCVDGSPPAESGPYIVVTSNLRVLGNDAAGPSVSANCLTGGWTPASLGGLSNINGMTYITRGSPSTSDTGNCATASSCNLTSTYFCIDPPGGLPAGTYRRTLELRASGQGLNAGVFDGTIC